MSAENAAWPNMCAYSVAMPVSRSGGSVIVSEPVIVPAQLGSRSISSGRAVQSSSSGTSRAEAPSSSTKRSIVSSAQCRSSKTSTVGRRAASATRNRRHADSASSARRAWSPGRPTSGRERVGRAGRPRPARPARRRPWRSRWRGGGGRVGVEDARLGLDDVGQRGERDVLAERRAAAGAPGRPARSIEPLGVLVQLADQPALADAGRGRRR